MFVVCPDCHSIYPLRADHLSQANGLLQCGQCEAVFHAASMVCDSFSDAQNKVAFLSSADKDVESVVAAALTSLDAAAAEAPPVMRQRLEQPDLLQQSVTEAFWEEDEAAVSRLMSAVTLKKMLVVVLAAILLAAGYLWIQSRSLAAYPAYRQYLEPFCALLKCELPLKSDLTSFVVDSLQVTDNPRVRDTLLLTLVFSNNAEFTQPFPTLRIAFSNASGTELSIRYFRPETYLSDDKERQSGLPSEASKRLLFELPDPGKAAVSYQLEFVAQEN